MYCIVQLQFLTSVLDGSGRLTQRPGRFTPGKQTWHPMYRRLGRRQGRSERRGGKPRPPTGVRTPNHPARSGSLYRLQNLCSIKPNIFIHKKSENLVRRCQTGFGSGNLPLGKGKVIPLQALRGPEGSRRLRSPDFKTIGT